MSRYPRRVRRTLAFFVLIVVAASLPGVAAAQSVPQVAEEIQLRGYHADTALGIPIDDLERLVDRHPDIGFVALDETPAGGADLFAQDVLDAVTGRDTIVVLTADEAGAASAVVSDGDLDAAFDAAFAGTGDGYLRDFEQVAEALASSPTNPDPSTPAAENGSSGFPIWPVVVLAGVALIGFRMWGNNRADDRAVARRFAEAKREIEAQMSAVANQILELSDRVDFAADQAATAHFRRASEVYGVAERRLGEATSTAAFEALADDLDEARWELAAAEAILDGAPVPSRPADDHPEPCFFDPTHGAGVEEAELATAAGTRTVRVCAADAGRLRRGERPDPRAITVDGRQVPASSAPRTHGGRGMDALGVFSILVGGMGDAIPYRWGRPRRRMGIPPFPGGFGVGSRARSTVSRTSGSGATRSMGRARRGR